MAKLPVILEESDSSKFSEDDEESQGVAGEIITAVFPNCFEDKTSIAIDSGTL